MELRCVRIRGIVAQEDRAHSGSTHVSLDAGNLTSNPFRIVGKGSVGRRKRG